MTPASRTPDSVRALLLSLSKGHVLLPYSVVEEIISWQEPTPVSGAPDWLLGTVPWRRWHLPVISAERLAGDPFTPPRHKAHIVVCNLMNGDEALPCIGIVTKGVPHLVRADASTLAPAQDGTERSPWAAVDLTFNGAPSWVPDFDAIVEALPRPELT